MIKTLLFLGLCAIIEKSRGEDLPSHVNYLVQYGYLEKSEEGGRPDSFSSDEIVSALKKAQKFAGIPPTGKLDNQTIAMVDGLRCGFPGVSERYETGSKWDKQHVTYGFINFTPQFRQNEILKLFVRAFQTWAQPTGLQFHLVDVNSADIKIGFFSYDHGDGDPFDGPFKVVAHSGLPNPRGTQVHFDESEHWTLYPNGQGIFLLSTAIHELGHALGLKHSNVPGSIMGRGAEWQTTLGYDDIQGIQSLYHF